MRRLSQRNFSKAINLLQGTVHATCTSNNTHAALQDNFGNLVAKKSAGNFPKGANKKSSSLLAIKVGEELGKEMKSKGFEHVRVLYKGIGKGRGQVHRGLENVGIKVVEIGEKHAIPHNGCRPPKQRRL